MNLAKTRSLGNGQLESECLHCGRLIVWQAGDQIFTRFDDDGKAGLLCGECHAAANQPAGGSMPLPDIIRHHTEGAMNDEKEELARRYGCETYAELLAISKPVPIPAGETVQSYVAQHSPGHWFVWHDQPPTADNPPS